MANLFKVVYGRQWEQEKRLWAWTWRKSGEISKPSRTDYRDIIGHEGHEYALISNSYLVRGVAGYFIWAVLRALGLLVTNGTKGTEPWGFYAYLAEPFWMQAVMMIIISAALYALTLGQYKRRTALCLRIPVSRAFIFLTIIAASLFLYAFYEQPHHFNFDVPSNGLVFGLIDNLSRLVVLYFFVLIVTTAFWPVPALTIFLGRLYFNNFRAIDGHPYLGPLTAIASVWATVIYDFILPGPTLKVRADAQFWLQLATQWGGPIILTAIAAIEIIWVRRHVTRLRDGSVRPPSPRYCATG